MPQFSLLARLQKPNPTLLQELIESLESQTYQDWELVLVGAEDEDMPWLALQNLVSGYPRVSLVQRPKDELLAWSCHHLYPGLGQWIGMLDQHDRLVPNALETMAAASAEHIDAQVLYSDECHRNSFNRLSFTTAKGAFDPFRLMTQEYLGSLALVRRDHLQALAGFDLLASDVPVHDLYLRTLEMLGPGAFAYVPQVLCQHHRSYLEPRPKDVRNLPHLVRYDLYACRRHLSRRGLLAQIKQEHGTLRIRYKHRERPGVVVWLLVSDDLEAGLARAAAFQSTLSYQHLELQLVHRGSNPDAGQAYQALATQHRWKYVRTTQAIPQLLNQALPYLAHDWLLILDGEPITKHWLTYLMDHAQLPGVAALGARCTGVRRIFAPGVLGYRYEGWDWNTRGRFNRLQVPHQVSALGSGCLLLNARDARALGGFREDLPTLWAMEYSMRLDLTGKALLSVPEAHIQVPEEHTTSPAERALLEQAWPTWQDRFGLHLPFQSP